MFHSKYDQTLALAGIYQAASLVKQIANTGTANSALIESSLETLFRFDASSVLDIQWAGGKIQKEELKELFSPTFSIRSFIWKKRTGM